VVDDRPCQPRADVVILAGQVIALRAPTVQSTAGWLQQPDAVDEKAS
jgi:hypothetical protein